MSIPRIAVDIGPLRLTGRLEPARAPATCAAFLGRLPLEGRLLQARWSGEAAWVPLGDLDLGVGPENATSRPEPGQLLWYPRGVSETEILVPYGTTVFGSKFGVLEGNHFLTLDRDIELLAEVGRLVGWEGAQPIRFTLAPPGG